METNIQHFDELSDEFFEYGLKESGLINRIGVDKLKSWFGSTPNSAEIDDLYWIEKPFSFALIRHSDSGSIYETFEVEEQSRETRAFATDYR